MNRSISPLEQGIPQQKHNTLALFEKPEKIFTSLDFSKFKDNNNQNQIGKSLNNNPISNKKDAFPLKYAQKLNLQISALKSGLRKNAQDNRSPPIIKQCLASPFTNQDTSCELELKLHDSMTKGFNTSGGKGHELIKKFIFDKDFQAKWNTLTLSNRQQQALTDRQSNGTTNRGQNTLSSRRDLSTRQSTSRKLNYESATRYDLSARDRAKYIETPIMNRVDSIKTLESQKQGDLIGFSDTSKYIDFQKHDDKTLIKNRSSTSLRKNRIKKNLAFQVPNYTNNDQEENNSAFSKKIDLFRANDDDCYENFLEGITQRETNEDDDEDFKEYEKEILGVYKNKSITKYTPQDIASNILHIQKLKTCLNRDTNSKKKFLIELIRNKTLLKKSIRKKDKDLIMQEFNNLLMIAINLDDVYLLLETYNIIGDIYMHIQDYQKAVTAYNQLRICSELSGNIHKKIDAFIGLADCCKHLSLFEQGFKFLKRALQYAWYLDEENIQYTICDKFGMLHYHLGDINAANQYHQKYSETTLFNKNFEQIKASNTNIKAYIKKHHLADTTITPLYFERLVLPKLEVIEHAQTNLGEITNHKKRKHFILPTSPSLCSKKGYSPGDTFYERIDAVFNNQKPRGGLLGEMPAQAQIDFIIGEQEFEDLITSPRISLAKQFAEEPIAQSSAKKRATTAEKLFNHKKRHILIQKQREDKSIHTLSQTISDKKLPQKDLLLRSQEKSDLGNTITEPPWFDELKKMIKYGAKDKKTSPMVLLTPQLIEKTNHCFMKTTRVNDKKLKTYFKNVLNTLSNLQKDPSEN